MVRRKSTSAFADESVLGLEVPEVAAFEAVPVSVRDQLMLRF